MNAVTFRFDIPGGVPIVEALCILNVLTGSVNEEMRILLRQIPWTLLRKWLDLILDLNTHLYCDRPRRYMVLSFRALIQDYRWN